MSTLIRRLILALATLAGLAPAFAQSPPPVPALPDTERRTAYSISASTCQCSVGFQLYADSTDIANWIQVWLNGVQVAASDPSFGWSLSTATTGGLANAPRPITNAVLTFALPQTGTVQIVGARRPRRTSQFQEGQPVPTRNINQLNTDIIAMEREIWDLRSRLIQGLPSETMNPLPSASARANNYLVFDTNGNPITAPGVTLIQYIASVNYATAAVLANSPVYANGASGVGATLTETGNGALSVDGNAPIVGNRILVLNQASTFQNGIYTVTAAGSAGASYVLTRTTDFNQTTEMFQGVSALVTGGTANIGTGWTLAASVATIGTSAVTFYETSVSVPNAAANLSFAQDYTAGVGFTAGVTTALTTTGVPLNAASSQVSFDGVVQSHNTWSLSGSIFTFLAAIPTNVQVVEIQYVSPSYFTNGVQTIGGASGPILLGTNLSIAGQTINASFTAQTSIDNLLPNVQWQQSTGILPAIKQKSDGSGLQSGASCASFTILNASPTFNCVNTQQIKVGDLVVVATANSLSSAYDNFWGFTSANYISCNAGTIGCQPTAGTLTSCTVNTNTCYVTTARVVTVVANTSITVQGNMGGIAPAASSAVWLIPIIRGDTSGGTSSVCPDGWTKTGSLISAPDDFSAHAYPGALRVLYTKGGITGTESCTYTVPRNQVARYQGQTVTFGVAANQTVQGGANTWNISITDSSGTSTSPSGTGSSFGGYQFEPITRTIAQNATSVTFKLNKTGNVGDIIYWALPTAGFVPSMVQSQLHQNSYEHIRANGHCNPPLLTPLIVGFSTAISTGLYGYLNLDLDAMSFDCYDKSLGAVYAKIEWTTTSVGSYIFTATNLAGLDFGPQTSTIVSGQPNVGGPAPIPLSQDGTFIIFTNTGSLVPSAGTFDFWDSLATMPSSVN